MAEQTFRSPGFFEREIDLTERTESPSGTPVGVVGTAQRGPAFVPVTVANFTDFQSRFGGLEPSRYGPYAVNEFLKNRNALTYLRVLGAGANSTIADIQTTQQYGTVKNAGLVVSGTHVTGRNAGQGFVQFLVAEHAVDSAADNVFPVFDNRSSGDGVSNTDLLVNLVRGAILFATGSRATLTGSVAINNAAINSCANVSVNEDGQFKLIISSSLTGFGTADGISGVRIYSASLNPHSENYYAKVLNTDPFKFESEQHLLLADFLVDSELASGSIGATASTEHKVALVSGSEAKSGVVAGMTNYAGAAGVTFGELFGRLDSRYTTPRTTSFISQPFGTKEYDLFHFETLSDGAFANNNIKVSIANLKASTDANNLFGTFEVQVRAFNDTDLSPSIVESFPNCSLNPTSDRYVARVIGDRKVSFNFDAEIASERRLVVSGRYGNQSQFIRVVVNSSVEDGFAPRQCLPFGFRGIPTLKTTDSLTDLVHSALVDVDGTTIGDARARMITNATTSLTGSIVPPMPYRFKVTRGTLAAAASGLVGTIGTTTRADRRYYWGVQNTRFKSGSILDPNAGAALNPIVEAYTKFVGIEKLDALVTGSGADAFNDNKFTLARVALDKSAFTEVTGTADEHMLNSAYLRSGVPTGESYRITDAVSTIRVTLATLIQSSSVVFNRFTPYAKFTNVFFGGFDGNNFLNKDSFYMTDRAASVDLGGYAADENSKLGLNGKQAGAGQENSTIASYRAAAEIMNDPFAVRTNVLAVPGIRDSYVTDYVAEKAKDYSLQMYLMDIPSYAVNNSNNTVRLFLDNKDASGARPDVRATAESFDSRALDNNYSATYFPDVYITDQQANNRVVPVPASVAALSAIGFNDRIGFPWFAPAGFNRGALEFVTNTRTRLLKDDRDVLYDARINPIANFTTESSAGQQFVIFGQKTLQQTQSALDRVNVRRLLLEIKRLVSDVANRLLFEANDAQTRSKFTAQIIPQLATIAAQQGIESFQVICDGSNNSSLDEEQNRMNGRIMIVPTRTIEFVAIDFIITNSGVSFV